MKRIIVYISCCLVGFAACRNVEPEMIVKGDEVLSAQIEQGDESKTVLDESKNILWSENDQIIAFMKSSYGHKYEIKPSFAGKTYADFSRVSYGNGEDLTAGMELNHIVAYYPYEESIECIKSETGYNLSIILPSEQAYAPESFGKGVFPMAAVSSSNDITFRNVCGGIQLSLKGTQKICTVEVKGNDGEKLSGKAVVTCHADEAVPSISMSSDAGLSVKLNCGTDGIQINESTATEFILVLPPVVFSHGFTVNIIDSEGNRQTIVSDKENTVFRSSILSMPELTLADSVKEPKPGDYVDEYGINHGQGIEIDEVVWAPVNCGYHATAFKYGKLYQWGRKYGQGYDGDFYDIDGNNIGQYYDASFTQVITGPVSLSVGQSEDNSSNFYKPTGYPYDWLESPIDMLWNVGSEEDPVKADYDPCPDGWRVPTDAELDGLTQNHSEWTKNADGQVGFWYTGATKYTDHAPKIFLSAAGYRRDMCGTAYNRGKFGYYWASESASNLGCSICFGNNGENHGSYRAYGHSVRCVSEGQNIPEPEPEPEPEPKPQIPDYIEGRTNYGPGIEIDGIVWAPVNCGGIGERLYQWGRPYYVYVDDYGDTPIPGPVTLEESLSDDYYYRFILDLDDEDWLTDPDDQLWDTGKYDEPVKGPYAPCPHGWRVPSTKEFKGLFAYNTSSWTTDDNGQKGYWFSGKTVYAPGVPAVFLPAAGYRLNEDEAALKGVNKEGYYWCSTPETYGYFNDSKVTYSGQVNRANAFSVRCVHE